MKIRKEKLLILASAVWFIAGFNILRIGFISYVRHITFLNLILSILVFVFFWFIVFNKLVTKHTNRIQNYKEEMQFVLKFFDIKSFYIMAFMMTFGIGIRAFSLVPEVFIAVFYSGLGCALFGAGILFGYNYFKLERKIHKE